MSMKYVLFIFIFWMMQSIFCSCSEPTTKVETTDGHDAVLSLSDAGYHLPDRPGYDLFLSNCGVCHSYRYIQMQPNFSRKTWEKTVDNSYCRLPHGSSRKEINQRKSFHNTTTAIPFY